MQTEISVASIERKMRILTSVHFGTFENLERRLEAQAHETNIGNAFRRQAHVAQRSNLFLAQTLLRSAFVVVSDRKRIATACCKYNARSAGQYPATDRTEPALF